MLAARDVDGWLVNGLAQWKQWRGVAVAEVAEWTEAADLTEAAVSSL